MSTDRGWLRLVTVADGEQGPRESAVPVVAPDHGDPVRERAETYARQVDDLAAMCEQARRVHDQQARKLQAMSNRAQRMVDETRGVARAHADQGRVLAVLVDALGELHVALDEIAGGAS